MTNKLQLQQAVLKLNDQEISVYVPLCGMEYTNTYTAFEFDSDHAVLIAPNFRMKILNVQDAKQLSHWLMSFYL